MEGKTRIPKIIHFVWIDFKNELSSHPQIPEKYLENIELCRKLHPDFEIKIWDGKMSIELLQEHYPWFVEKYTKFSQTIMRCDAIRFFILHAEGGIYSDIDVKFLKNIEPIMTKADCVFRSSSAFKIGNDFMMSRKESDFMNLCCTNIKEDKFKTPFNYHVMNTAGPAFLYKQFKKYKGTDSLLIDDSILPKDIFLRGQSSSKDCYIETTLDGSWQSDWDRFLVKLLRKLLVPIYNSFLFFKRK